MIDYAVDADGIATIAFAMADRPFNVLNAASVSAFAARVEEALGDAAVRGVIVTSARPDFVVGADLGELANLREREAILAFIAPAQRVLRRMETGGKPFVAALRGKALGGGLEVALACHRRIAAEGPDLALGLPEVTLGLLPAGGGTQRLPRLVGAAKALPLLVEGRSLGAAEALAIRLLDEIVPPEQLVEAARRWLLGDGSKGVVQPWDRKGARFGDQLETPAGRDLFAVANAMMRDRTAGQGGAPLAILSCVYEGLRADIDTALGIEVRAFVGLLGSREARARIATFFALGKAKRSRRPAAIPARVPARIGVLGAGMMGAGIALVSAEAGMEVALVDRTPEAAEAGRAAAAAVLGKRVDRGRLAAEERDRILARIRPTAAYEDLSGAELVVEAVFEDRAVKAEVTRRAESRLGSDTVFASNTSTLPISGLAEASARPERFIGLHFFSPVDRMSLVEVIRGQATADDTLWRALDYVAAIGKTAIVVNDSRGFYTSRVVARYVDEGLHLLLDGVAPALIENAGRRAGMPVGPLALADEVALDLMHALRVQTRKDLGESFRPERTDDALAALVNELGRTGRKAKRGFYDYPAEGPKRLWAGSGDLFPRASRQPPVEEVVARLLHVQSAETARAMDEGVVTAPADADVGAILGWGYPAARGGPVRHIDETGIARFVAESDALAQTHGERFAPPPLLRRMAEQGERFYP